MKLAMENMNIKMLFAICLAGAGGSVFAQQDDDFEKKGLEECQAVANKINKSHKVGILAEGMIVHGTWRAGCAEQPPTGPGRVTALCEAKRKTDKGEQGVFFWQKSHRGKLNTGYFICGE